MRPYSFVIRIAVMAIILGSALAGISGVAAQEPADEGDAVAITVQAFLCPFGFEGGDVYTGCDEPAEGVLVSLSRDGTFIAESEIGADGSVFFGDLATGTFTIELGVPGDFAEFRTACGAPGANEGLTIDGAGTNRIGITLGEGARPTCTFFVIREDAGAPTDEEKTEEPTGEVTLPSTGSGVAADGVHANILLGTAMLLLSGTSLMVRHKFVR